MNETTGYNDPQRPQLQLTLNPDAIRAPTLQAVVLSSEIVDFLYEAMAKADLSKKPSNDVTRYKFVSLDIAAIGRRAMFENWIFSKSFQDLMRGVRASLEQAYFFLELGTRPQKIKSDTTLAEFFAPIKRRAATLNFGQLLDQVNTKLGAPLNFVDAYNSLQRARNCFEHRSGIVGDVDTSSGDVMTLSFPRVKTFYLRHGEEIELEPGHVVDAQDGADEVQILMRIDLRERQFAKNNRLSLSLTDFNEIAFACNYFASDMATKVTTIIDPAPA